MLWPSDAKDTAADSKRGLAQSRPTGVQGAGRQVHGGCVPARVMSQLNSAKWFTSSLALFTVAFYHGSRLEINKASARSSSRVVGRLKQVKQGCIFVKFYYKH